MANEVGDEHNPSVEDIISEKVVYHVSDSIFVVIHRVKVHKCFFVEGAFLAVTQNRCPFNSARCIWRWSSRARGCIR